MLGTSNKIKRPQWPSWVMIPIGITIPERLPEPDDNTFRIAVATRGEQGLDDVVDILDMARSRYFTIVDVDLNSKEIKQVKIVKNTLTNVPRASLAVAYWLVKNYINMTIASGYCHNMAYYLDQSGVTRIIQPANKQVRQCLQELGIKC